MIVDKENSEIHVNILVGLRSTRRHTHSLCVYNVRFYFCLVLYFFSILFSLALFLMQAYFYLRVLYSSAHLRYTNTLCRREADFFFFFFSHEPIVSGTEQVDAG